MRLTKFSGLFVLLGFFSISLWADSDNYQSPLQVPGTVAVSLEQAKLLHAKGMLFVDVRSPRQYAKRHIPGAINLYIKQDFTEPNLLRHLGRKDRPFLVYCNGVHCSLSSKAARQGVTMGFSAIHYFRGGARAWRLDGNQLESGDEPS
jgi:rhodanese-related sulfurtransferase